VGGSLSYEVDLFGRVKRSIEAAHADTGVATAALDAARVLVAAEVTRSYVLTCSYAAQARVARETIALQAKTVDLTKRSYQGGRLTQRAVDQAETLYDQAVAALPALEAEHHAAQYALNVLIGRAPEEIVNPAKACTIIPKINAPLPVGDGAALLARRPDVRRAEHQLAADTARIGVATAALYPSVSLGGSAALNGSKFGDLAKSAAFSYSIGPLIAWNIPNLTIARARVREASAGARVSLASFDGTVLTALKESEQALARLDGETKRNQALARAAAASADAARFSRLRFDYGADSFFELLDAERTRAQTASALAQSDGALVDAQINVFKALGGGWKDARP